MFLLTNIPEISIVPRGMSREMSTALPTVKVLSRKLLNFVEPEEVFQHFFAEEAYAFWLDSSRVESDLSRFSFMGATNGPLSKVIKYDSKTQLVQISDAQGQTELTEDIFNYIDSEIHKMQQHSNELPFDFNGGFVGYFGYELKAECGANEHHVSSNPDALFILADRLIAFDHNERCIYLVSIVPYNAPTSASEWFDATEQQLQNVPSIAPVEVTINDTRTPLNFELSQSYAQYVKKIEECKKYITEGETYEVCLTNRININEHFNPLVTYRILRNINPAPYSSFLKFGELSVLCSSPERFLKIDQDRVVEAKPIKGTIARGKNIEDDLRLAEILRTSEKDRAENLMIVDLLRNDLGLVCDIGSVHVPKLMAIESYQTVHQLVSTIKGTLRAELTAIDCIRSAFPGGSMTGAPKIRTMDYIDKLETNARGIYSGAIGFLSLNGTTDLNIVIRTIIMTPEQATVGVGGAITILSDPEREFEETLLKGRALVKALTISQFGKFDKKLYTFNDPHMDSLFNKLL